MSTILFSSGTSGGQPKFVVCSLEDLNRQRKAMSHFWELCPSEGPVLNTLPAAPHLGYHFAKMYEEFCPYPQINTGGYSVMSAEKHINLIKNFKPYLIIGVEPVVMELINLSGGEGIKIAVIANGASRDSIQKLEAKGIKVFATYGFTEAKMAWLTSSVWQNGYRVYKDSGVRFENDGDELVMYSPDYPEGYHTGDLGQVEDGQVYQLISFFIRRNDGKTKNLIGCTRV